MSSGPRLFAPFRLRSVAGKLWLAFVLLSGIPLVMLGVAVAVQAGNIRDQALQASRAYELRAQAVARRIADFLHSCERDLRELASRPRTEEAFAEFARQRKRQVWLRAGTNAQPREERMEIPLYKEVAWVEPGGRERILIWRGQPVPEEQRRDVSQPKNTTYRGESYFAEAMRLPAGSIWVSHLTGFHVNRIQALGIEKLITQLKDRSPRDRAVYRFLLYEMLRAGGEVEESADFEEKDRRVQVYGVPGEETRILVEVPPDLSQEEARARELELRTFLNQFAPEDVVEGTAYDGVLRFAMPIDSDGERQGLLVLALDALHLFQFVQHIKAMDDDATVFAGYRDADYTFLFDDQGWVIAHPKLWNVRGLDRTGRPLLPYGEKSLLAEALVGHLPLNLLHLDFKLGEGYHRLVLETRAGRTGIATAQNLAGVLCTRVYSPIFYDTGPYAEHGIFGGVMLGTRADRFIGQLEGLSAGIARGTGELRRMFLWIFAGSLLLLTILSGLVARWLVRPVRSLAAAARRIGGGDLATPLPEPGGDEIGDLGRAFGEMTGALRRNIAELSQANQELRETQHKLLQAERDKRHKIQRELEELQQQVARASFQGIIAESPAMKTLIAEIARVAASSATVLILGENGTGKERVAEAIHRNSQRREQKFLKVNCAAFNENLLESELFGHVKGAFTGANADRKGLFEAADGGTLLLDEIGDMSLSMQSRLLRTLQEGEVVPVGSTRVVKVDVRMIAATNQDLPALIREGRFREDLFHRINVISLRVPPLRERREDILPLCAQFIQQVCEREGKPLLALDAQAEKFLLEYRWPGNVRELENAVERAVIRALGDTLRLDDFQLSVDEKDLPCVVQGLEKNMTLEQVERAYILAVLDKHHGNKKAAAEELGIGYNTLWRKLKSYGKL
ncbi:MAG: sigma 54-interacting transcriptional regulator [Myxococcales bacterium]|nr:sigma 54-interacting transcriptional regulator [Myxococcales bacterium]